MTTVHIFSSMYFCRDRLFELINELPTCYEIVSGKVPTSAGSKNPRKRSAPPPVRPTAAGRQPKPVGSFPALEGLYYCKS